MKAFMIINPRAGQDLTRFPDIMTVFAAAGWSVDNALVEYGGQERKLAVKAVKDGYTLLIAHGGDGTIQDVVEAVVSNTPAPQEKSRKSEKPDEQIVVGALSGGTANQWVHEIGYPTDPVQAALALINSDVRHVDVGRIMVENISFPVAQHQKQKAHKKAHAESARHFLLTAGFGIDASVISHTSKSLKERVGTLAYDVAATKELPEQHPYYAQIHAIDTSSETHTNLQPEQQAESAHYSNGGHENAKQYGRSWQGQALQIVVGNTRRYADVVELTPDAYIDDGLLDICVIVDGGVVRGVQQIASLLFQKKPDDSSTIMLRDAHLTITLPAHIGIQLDGGVVHLKHFLSVSEQEALEHQTDLSQVLVTYRIDVIPQAVAVAVPRTYDNTLFSRPASSTQPQLPEENTSLPSKALTRPILTQPQMDMLARAGQPVTVVGIVPDPAHTHTYVVAGTVRDTDTGDIKPVALCINLDTHIYTSDGEPHPVNAVQEVQAGKILHVVGKESKRGVIQATHLQM